LNLLLIFSKKALHFLQSAGIEASIILDAAVGYYMNKVDMVLSGAEGVVENGGVINQIGTYQIAVIARSANKPFYVVAESFKFVRVYPLNQYDLPSNFSVSVTTGLLEEPVRASAEDPNPFVDYTPPAFISLLFTDIGVLTPSGVSDELIKLYY
jgi:translation initiation factor eIF-2B subunit alpha